MNHFVQNKSFLLNEMNEFLPQLYCCKSTFNTNSILFIGYQQVQNNAYLFKSPSIKSHCYSLTKKHLIDYER